MVLMYMEEETMNWAMQGMSDDDKPFDCNGVELKKGDDVTVIKDLPVRGTNQVIKQGTVIRGISIGDDLSLSQAKPTAANLCMLSQSSAVSSHRLLER